MRPQAKTPRQRKRLAWLASCTRWTKLGTETLEGDVLITNIGRKPPAYRLEQFQEDGQKKVAMLVKAPKGDGRHWDVVVDGEGRGFRTKSKRAAILRFAELQTVDKATLTEEQDTFAEEEQDTIAKQILAGAAAMLDQGEEAAK